MKKFCFILILTITITTACANSVSTFKANDKGITYTGRTETNADGSVSYDWVGVYMQTDFTGSSIAIDASESGASYHNIFIDGKFLKKIKIEGKDKQHIVLASNLSKGTHRLRLQKCTEGEYGCTTIHDVVVSKGGSIKAVEKKQRMIEIYGDSYTCGYGTESNSAADPFKLETENCDKAYGCLIARYFNADYALVAHSGQGLIRNWADKAQVSEQNMTTRHTQIFDAHSKEQYDFKAYRPDLVMINLGTNDFSPVAIPTCEQFVEAYIKLIESIRNHYGEVPILCITAHSAGTYLSTCMGELAKKVKGYKGVYMANSMRNIVTQKYDMGASYHPNYQGQQKIAMTLIPKISAIMEWNLTNSAVY